MFSTDFRNLLWSLRQQVFKFGHDHYQSSEKTGVALSEPTHEFDVATNLINYINKALRKDYERHRDTFTVGRWLKWSKQNKDN